MIPPAIVRQAVERVRGGESVHWACSIEWMCSARAQRVAVDDYLTAIAHRLTVEQASRDVRFREIVRELTGK